MPNPTFECECMHVHKDVKTNLDIAELEDEVFDQPGYTKGSDENVYFVHDNVKQAFENIYNNLPSGDEP